ncbi:MAG: hypothetical protein II298_02040 [Bacteroidales bacterium]|nr:hypothetical protein [Bacteroidales bacterium]
MYDEEKNYGFTQINWNDVIRLQKVVKKSAEINQVNKLSYADLLIISIIKGYGRKGFFGTYKKIGELIDMSENQVCKHLNKIKKIKSIYNETTIFIEENDTLIFNLKFLVEQYEYKDEYADLPF